MRLVNDHREPPPGDSLPRVSPTSLGHLFGCQRGDDRELLQRRDDDSRRVPLQRRLELRGVFVDPHDHPGGVLDPRHGVLQLPVEHLAVGDDDDLVEDRRIVRPVEPRQRMAVHAMVFDFPDPAECCTSRSTPAPSR